jgi:hypothetical protein
MNCLCFNPLNTELNPICHLLALLGARHILHVSRIRVNVNTFGIPMCAQLTLTYNLWEGTEDDWIAVETCSPIVISENKCCADVNKLIYLYLIALRDAFIQTIVCELDLPSLPDLTEFWIMKRSLRSEKPFAETTFLLPYDIFCDLLSGVNILSGFHKISIRTFSE